MKKVFWLKLVVLVSHAAIAHQVVSITHAEKRSKNIASSSGVYGPVAVTLEVEPRKVAAPPADSETSSAERKARRRTGAERFTSPLPAASRI